MSCVSTGDIETFRKARIRRLKPETGLFVARLDTLYTLTSDVKGNTPLIAPKVVSRVRDGLLWLKAAHSRRNQRTVKWRLQGNLNGM